jgi:hypothetical protein
MHLSRSTSAQRHGQVMLRTASTIVFDQHVTYRADLRRETAMESGLAGCAQSPGTFRDGDIRDLRHARGRRARTRRIRKHMQEGEIAFAQQIERSREHFLRLGWEAGDNIGAKRNIGPQTLDLCAKRDRFCARMPALHSLENQVVARLQREMQMRHQSRVVREHVEQV